MTAMSRIADEAIAAAAEVPRFEDGSINLREVIRQLAESVVNEIMRTSSATPRATAGTATGSASSPPAWGP